MDEAAWNELPRILKQHRYSSRVQGSLEQLNVSLLAHIPLVVAVEKRSTQSSRHNLFARKIHHGSQASLFLFTSEERHRAGQLPGWEAVGDEQESSSWQWRVEQVGFPSLVVVGELSWFTRFTDSIHSYAGFWKKVCWFLWMCPLKKSYAGFLEIWWFLGGLDWGWTEWITLHT